MQVGLRTFSFRWVASGPDEISSSWTILRSLSGQTITLDQPEDI